MKKLALFVRIVLFTVFLCAFSGYPQTTDIYTDRTPTNMAQLAEAAFSGYCSVYLPDTAWEWRAYSTDGGQPWWVDCSQWPCLDLSPASTNVNGVALFTVRLTKNVLTGEMTIQSDSSTDLVARIEAQNDYQPGARVEDRGVWWMWQQVTNCLECWGIEGEIPPPTVTLRIFFADVQNKPTWDEAVAAQEAAWEEAQAEAEAQASLFALQMQEGATLLMDSDPCDTNDTFAIISISMDTNQHVTITWPACESNFLYEVQSSPALSTSTVWASEAVLLGIGTWADTNAPAFPARFYRVRRLATPNGDYDGDGMPDAWELAHGLNPLLDDAAGDADGDGYSNLNEYDCGTDPQNPNSYPDPAVNVIAPWSVWAGTSGLTATVAPFFTTLHQFTSVEGQSPSGELIQGSDGYIYGTTPYGGTNGKGIVFRMDSSGALTTLVSFTVGAQPQGALVEGTDGYFYGTTYGGGTNNSGTVFKMSPAGTLTTLYQFSYTTMTNGFSPQAGLVEGSDGCFYGTTYGGGMNWNGTVFKITSAGTLTTLHKFGGGSDGCQPYAGLVLGNDGDFYGTTSGGCFGNNTVFKISSSGTLTTIYSFTGGVDGRDPYAGLVQGTDGYFYGTTLYGGTNNNGTVFKITSAGTLTTLHKFTGGVDGAAPYAGLTQATDGDFYGATSSGGAFNDGTVFRISSAGTITVLHHFNYDTEGSRPMRGLLQASNGAFYGATSSGPPPNFQGTLFKLSKSPATYNWSLSGGTLTAGQDTTNITWTAADNTNIATLCVTVSSGTNCTVTRCKNVIVNCDECDSDGDGLRDWEEVNVYHTDPNNPDSDGDGMPDGWEVAHGLNPLDSDDATADSDADGYKNLEEYLNGTDPLVPDALPDIVVNQGQPYAVSRTILIGTSSTNYPNILVSLDPTMANAVLLANSGVITYTLPDADGYYDLYFRFADAQGQQHSPMVTGAVTLDRLSPIVAITAPTNNAVLGQRFVTLQASVADPDPILPSSRRPMKIWINDEPFWDQTGTNILVDRFPVPSGTNSFTVTIRAADDAGNTNEVSRTWMVDSSNDAVAPQMSSFNVTNSILVPDVSELWLEGHVDDAYAVVNAIVSGTSEEVATNALHMRGLQTEGLITLEFGTNQVVVLASDWAGNSTSNVLTIIRTDRYRAAITNPVFGAFADAPSNYVSGYVSAKFDEGLSTEANITSVGINGMVATLGDIDSNGNRPFTSTQQIPLGVPITGTIGGTGIPSDPPPAIPPAMSQEYEVTHKESFTEDNFAGEGDSGTLDRNLGTVCWYSDMSLGLYWRVADVPVSTSDVQIKETYQNGNLFDDSGPICVTILNPDALPWNMSEPWSYSSVETGPESRELSFGLHSYKHGYGIGSDTGCVDWFPCVVGTGYRETAYVERHRAEGSIRFRAPRHYDTNTTVIFTFEGVDYRRAEGKPLDLSQVKFRGQDPIAYSNETQTLSYLLTVDGGKQYTISQNDFTWPADQQPGHYSSSWANPDRNPCNFYLNNSFAGSWIEDMHWLSWTNFHNNPLCGPDVTELVSNVLTDVDTTWAGWSTAQKCEACSSLHDIVDKAFPNEPASFTNLVAGWAWDMEPLASIGFNNYIYIYPIQQGSPKNLDYGKTVEFQGKCYLGSAVNYALWGKMNRLCSDYFYSGVPVNPFSLYAAQGSAWLFKLVMYSGHAATEARTFTAYGYNGADPSSVAIPDVAFQTNNVIPANKGSFTWWPNQGTDRTLGPTVQQWCVCTNPPCQPPF